MIPTSFARFFAWFLGGTALLGCGSDSSSSSKSSAEGGSTSGAGSGGVTGGTGGAVGGAAGSGGLGGSAGQLPDVGTFDGFTGVLHRIGINNNGPCVADTNGIVTCDSSFSRPPTVALSTFSLGSDVSGDTGCGLTPQGEARCWGDEIEEATPLGPFSAISVGDGTACGVRPNGSLTCWGDDDTLEQVPVGEFTDVSVDERLACALASAGHVECWGNLAASQGARVDGSFKQVMVAFSTRCTLDAAGVIDCMRAEQATPAAGPFDEVSIGSSHICGLRADGSVGCWGEDSLGRVAPPPGTWSDIASYSGVACVRSDDGQSACWGSSYGDGGSVLECTESSTELAGTLEGVNFSVELNASKQVTFDDLAGFRWTYRTYPDSGVSPGLFILEGDEELSNVPHRSLMDGQMVSVEYALLQLESSATSAGSFYCSSSATATQHIDELSLALGSVHAIGGCPGSPVSGELTVNYYAASALSGTVDGMTVALRGDQGSQIGTTAGTTAIYHEDGTITVVHKLEGGALGWGIVAMPLHGPHAGAVYCAGEGSTWVVSEEDDTTVSTLANLSKLPSCPTESSTDTLSGCVR